MDGLTPLQKRCLLLVRDFLQREGRAPTRRELAKLVGQKSTNGVNQILKALEKKRFIKLDPPERSRNIVLLCMPERQLTLLEQEDSTAGPGGRSNGRRP